MQEQKDLASDNEKRIAATLIAVGSGNPEAMFQLGVRRANGDGLEKDLVEATRWYRKAADLGCVNAMVNLGYHYQLGRGVTRDLREAERWYRQAAERGARAERQVADRGSRERNVNGRQARERNVDVFVDDSEQVGERGASRAAVEARVTPQTPEPVARPNETNNARGGALAGGLNGSTGATTIGGVDPFAIVNEQLETVPFASSDASFDAIGLPTTQGLIETPNGQPTVASPTSTPQTAQGQRQTWIRGKR